MGDAIAVPLLSWTDSLADQRVDADQERVSQAEVPTYIQAAWLIRQHVFGTDYYDMPLHPALLLILGSDRRRADDVNVWICHESLSDGISAWEVRRYYKERMRLIASVPGDRGVYDLLPDVLDYVYSQRVTWIADIRISPDVRDCNSFICESPSLLPPWRWVFQRAGDGSREVTVKGGEQYVKSMQRFEAQQVRQENPGPAWWGP